MHGLFEITEIHVHVNKDSVCLEHACPLVG